MQEIQRELAGLKWGKTHYETASEQYKEQLIWGQYHRLRQIHRLEKKIQFRMKNGGCAALHIKTMQMKLRAKNWILNSGDGTPMRELMEWVYAQLRKKDGNLTDYECGCILKYGRIIR